MIHRVPDFKSPPNQDHNISCKNNWNSASTFWTLECKMEHCTKSQNQSLKSFELRIMIYTKSHTQKESAKKCTTSHYQKNIRLIKNEYWMTQFWKVFCINHSLFSWRQHKLVPWLNKKKSKLLICNICVFRVRCANTTLSIKSHKLCFTNSEPSKQRITE